MSTPDDEQLLNEIKEAIQRHHEAAAEFREEMVALVRRARARGWSWTEIGKALGVSRQSAFTRYARVIGGGEAEEDE